MIELILSVLLTLSVVFNLIQWVRKGERQGYVRVLEEDIQRIRRRV